MQNFAIVSKFAKDTKIGQHLPKLLLLLEQKW